MIRRRVLAAVLLTASVAGGVALAVARIQGSAEEVKAAFLFKFTQFVEWPARAFAEPTSPYAIGVLGRDSLGTALDDSFKGKTVNGRAFTVVRSDDPAALRSCHVVYVAEADAEKRGRILEAFKSANTLVVGDGKGFAEAGASVGFVLEDRRIKLEVNPAAASRAGLKISSKLLQVSRIVEDKEGSR